MVNSVRTRNELVLEAAKKLNIVGTGQVLEDEYAVQIDGNVDPLFMQLAADDICEIANDNAIPSEWFDSLAGLLANVSTPIALKNYDPQVKLVYESQLRRLNSLGPTYNIQEAEYF